MTSEVGIRPKRIKDISGMRFGMLSVVKMNGRVTSPCGSIKTTYLCLCDCGKKTTTKRSNLVNGYTKSCGCYLKIAPKEKAIHNLTGTRIYKCWSNMKTRCTNENNKHFDSYGGRGISVCKEWSSSFVKFHEDMGDMPKNKTIDRIDVDGDYSKENCRWATIKTQSRNKRNTRYVKFGGLEKSLSDWCEEFGLNYYTTHSRLFKNKNKMTLEQILKKEK